MTNLLRNPLVSIIIVNWNRCEDVLETLQKLTYSNYKNIEVILVDNGSTDNSPKVLLEKFPHINLIALPNNIGCEDGNNVGILNADGEFLIFLDSDADIEPNGISKILNVFEGDADIGIVEPRIIRPADNKILNEAKYWPKSNTFTGCVVAFRASVFKEVGLRPGEFFLYSSEPEICLRVIEYGYKIVHCPDIIGHHRESPVARANKLFYYLATRNTIWLIWRHYPFMSAIYETIILLIVHFYRSIYHRAIHYFLWGVVISIYGFKSHVIGKRKPLKRFNEARVFPGFKMLTKIIFLKFMNKKGEV
jgi:GT2 family glycosyltransferase